MFIEAFGHGVRRNGRLCPCAGVHLGKWNDNVINIHPNIKSSRWSHVSRDMADGIMFVQGERRCDGIEKIVKLLMQLDCVQYLITSFVNGGRKKWEFWKDAINIRNWKFFIIMDILGDVRFKM